MKNIYAICTNKSGDKLQITYIEQVGHLKFNIIASEVADINKPKDLYNRIKQISNGNKLKAINFKIDSTGIKPIGYKFEIFENTKYKPNIAIANIISSADNSTLGYVAYSSNNRAVCNIKAGDAVVFHGRIASNNCKFFQNKKFIGAVKDESGKLVKKAHFQSFVEGAVPDIVYNVEEKVKPSRYKAGTVEKEGAKSKFNKEQLEVLAEGRNAGVAYLHFAKPEIPAESMRELLKLEKAGFNSSYLADPKYDTKVIKFYRIAHENKINIKAFSGTDSKGRRYIAHQFNIHQLSEIMIGIISGIKYRKYMNPKLSATEMAEIRIRLENNLWSGRQMFNV